MPDADSGPDQQKAHSLNLHITNWTENKELHKVFYRRLQYATYAAYKEQTNLYMARRRPSPTGTNTPREMIDQELKAIEFIANGMEIKAVVCF